MAISQQTIRKITIQGDGRESVDGLTAAVTGLDTATKAITTTAKTSATVTDMVSKRQLSAAEAYRRQTLSVVDGARAQDQYQRALRVTDAALKQGIITAGQHADRVALLQRRYLDAGSASNALASFTGGLGKAFGLAAGALSLFGVSLGAAALIEYAKNIFTTTADLHAQADQILGAGGNVEALQAFRNAFRQNGIETDAGDKIIAKLTLSLGQAAEGSKETQDAFKALGLGSKQLAGASADAALPLVAARLLQIKDAQKAATVETALFGKSGQQLESVLVALAAPLQQQIDQAKKFGVVVDESMIKKADEAKNSLEQAWQRLGVAIAPVITEWVNGFAKFVDQINGSGGAAEALDDLATKLAVLAGIWAGAKMGALFGPWGGVAGAVIGGAGAYVATNPTKTGNFIGNLGLAAEGYDTTPAAANDNVPFRGLITQAARNGGPIESVTVTANRNSAAAWKPTQADIDAYNKIKVTFAGYVAEETEAARLASESAAQRETELAVIKGAQIAQKEHNVATRDTVKNYADAVKYLGQARAEQIEIQEAQKRVNQLGLVQDQQLQSINAGLAVDADHRALILKNLDDEIAAGVRVGDQYEQQRRQIEAKNAAIQAGMDATRLKDYLADLKEEASLAGLSADEREREAAVLQAMHMTHGTLKADQADEIRSIIEARQATERWRELVDSIADAFQGFFEDVLNKGKLSFGSLWDSVKQQFVRMLAYMASQALIQPIIIPMVQQFAGSFGSGVPGALSGGVNPFMSLGGGGDLLGLASSGGLLSGLGSALGFSAGPGVGSLVSLGSITGANGAAVSLGSISSATPALPGSLFGSTTLGGFLGGVGLGSMAGSLVFGNKNDAGVGSMGGALAGAAIGSIIPGIGTIIGGLAGGLLGGGLGSLTGSSNQGAIANFNQGGLGSYLFKQGGGNNGQLSTQAANSVSATIKSLQDAGVNVSLGNITGLSIGSDKSYVYDSAGGKQKLGGGDVEGVVNAILTRILPSASATSTQAQTILDRYNANGGINAGNLQQLVADLGAAKQFADALNNLTVGQDSLSEGAKALKAINDQIDPLVKQAQSLGLSTDSLEAARAQATAALVQSFDDNVSASLKQLTDPVGAQLDALIKAQADRFKSAQDLGADVSKLAALNDAELANFFNGLSADQLAQVQADMRNNPAYQAAAQAAQAQADAAASSQALADATDHVKQAQDNLAKAYGDSISQYRGQAASLRAYLQQVGQGAADPLSAYRSARSAFLSTSALAQGGDIDALQKLQQQADDFLNASKAASQTLAQYGSDRALVIGNVSGAATAADKQADDFQRQLDALNAQIDGLVTLNKTTLSVKDAIDDLNEALAVQAKATADNTAKMAKILTNVTRDGNSLITAAA